MRIRKPSAVLTFALCAAALSALAAGCGTDPVPATFPVEVPDAVATFTLRIDPPLAQVKGVLGAKPSPSTQFRALRTEDGKETDVTKDVQWSMGDGSVTASVSGGLVSFDATSGGEAKVIAISSGVAASAKVQVSLTGDAYVSGADEAMKRAFEMASVDGSATAAPTLDYPENQTVFPANLPALEFQWSKAGATAYRVHFTGTYLDLSIYSKDPEWLPSPALWDTLRKSTTDAPDAGTGWNVEALLTPTTKGVSTKRSFNTAVDPIDNSAIYVWQSSTGSFRVLDVSLGKDFPLPSSAPDLQPGQPCVGCHRISRDGKRFAYTATGALNFGTLAFDAVKNEFAPKIAPSTSFRGTYASFDPLESTRVPAMLVAVPDVVPQNTAGTVRLQLRNPETNAVVPNNLETALAALADPAPGKATSMPDWSPDGSFVAFSAYSSNKNFVRLLGDDIVSASIVEIPVSFAGGTYTFGAPTTLVAADAAADPDVAENFLLPAVSPDGLAISYTNAKGWWAIKTQTSLINLSGNIEIVRRADKQRLVLANGSPGTNMSNTWSQWAPKTGKRYAWLAYASERPYGHRLTRQNQSCGALVQGQQGCKQLWVTAIDLSKLKSGSADPSFAPFWIPGQNIGAQYVSPQWTTAVLTPPK
jgi:hypothetical protein